MHSQHAHSSLRALYQVFVVPALSKQFAVHKSFACQNRIPITRPRRHFSITPIRSVKTRAPEQRTQKWDSEITAQYIYLVDSETGKLSEPRTRYDILNSLDMKTHRLIQLTEDKPNEYPVCKIVSKKESYEADKKRKAQQKEAKKLSKVTGEAAMKTLELNWAIDQNDLGHRLDRMKEFLGEGRRVEVVLAKKKHGRKATLEECKNVLSRIRETVDSVDGAKERDAMTGKMGGFATLTFQGKPVTVGSSKRDDAVSQKDDAGGQKEAVQ